MASPSEASSSFSSLAPVAHDGADANIFLPPLFSLMYPNRPHMAVENNVRRKTRNVCYQMVLKLRERQLTDITKRALIRTQLSYLNEAYRDVSNTCTLIDGMLNMSLCRYTRSEGAVTKDALIRKGDDVRQNLCAMRKTNVQRGPKSCFKEFTTCATIRKYECALNPPGLFVFK